LVYPEIEDGYKIDFWSILKLKMDIITRFSQSI